MTTYRLFKRRWTRSMLTLIATLLVVGVLQASLKPDAITKRAVSGACLVLFMGVLWRLSQTPCLHCRRPLGFASLLWVGSVDPFNPPCCPHCGTSILRNFAGIADEG